TEVEYQFERKSAAKRLEVQVSYLDGEVAARRRLTLADEDPRLQGRGLALPEAEPHTEAVQGPDLLAGIAGAIKRHVVMADDAANMVALWIVHTYLLDSFGISPRLAITSPEKQCGKTTLLDVLEHLVWRPLPTTNTSASAIFRVVEISRPCLLAD